MRCTNCGTENPNDSLFCMECGTKMKREDGASARPSGPQTPVVRKTQSCPTCGVDNDPGDTFCKMCGAVLNNAQATRQVTDVCRFCGKPVPEKDAFCPHCGRRHRQPHAPTPPGGMPAATPPPVTPPAGAPITALPAVPRQNFAPAPPAPMPAVVPAAAPFAAPAPQPASPSPAIQPAPSPAGAPASPSPGQLYFAPPPAASLKDHGCTLRMLQGHRAGERFPFTKSITLGRHVGEILFSADEYLDARHLVINTLPDGVLVQDMNTVNGAFYLSPGETEISPGTHFLMDDYLFQYLDVPAQEWSLVNVWERGAKLMGSLRSERPWGRLQLFSPQGSVAATWLLWQEEIQLCQLLGVAPAPGQPGCRLKNRKGSAILSPGDREIYIRIRNQQSFQLPLRLRLGLQVLEITSS